MKKFNPKNNTSVFNIEKFLSKTDYSENDIVEAVNLLGNTWQEIKALRSRLEIDRYYVHNNDSEKFELELSKDNRMLGFGDKICCLEIELDELCKSAIEGKAKRFVEMNFPKYNDRKI